MRRRQFLASSGVGLFTVLSGCSVPAVRSRRTGDHARHPFADRTLSVRIDALSETDHDVEANASEALEYWTENSDQYVGFGVGFSVGTSESPDIVIEYVDDPSRCHDVPNFSENVLGCAPIITPGSRFRGTATATVVAGARPFGKIRITTKHELGHIFGLGHDDEPREIMSNRPEDRIPLYDVRIRIWETVLDGHELVVSASRLFSDGVSQWNEGQFDSSEVAFAAANDDFTEGRLLFQNAYGWSDEFEGHPRVETVDLAGLRAHLEALDTRLNAAEHFTELMATASRRAGSGNEADAQSLVRQANEYIVEFTEANSPEVRDIAIALGLVRGFDRDTAIVEGDEDKL